MPEAIYSAASVIALWTMASTALALIAGRFIRAGFGDRDA
jgi:hypothetical protein